MSKNKVHIPHPEYEKHNENDGNIGWCGKLWCEVGGGEEITCKSCIKLRTKLVAGLLELAGGG